MLRPLLNRVGVQPTKKENKTPGGIIIPDTNKEASDEGVVVSVGPGFRKSDGGFAPLDLKVGDKVLFKKGYGSSFKEEGTEYLVLTESEVLGVLQ